MQSGAEDLYDLVGGGCGEMNINVANDVITLPREDSSEHPFTIGHTPRTAFFAVLPFINGLFPRQRRKGVFQ